MRAGLVCDSALGGECVTELVRRDGFAVERRSCAESFTPGSLLGADLLLVETAAWLSEPRAVPEGEEAAPRPRTVWLTDRKVEPAASAMRPEDAVVEWPFSPDELLLEVRALCGPGSSQAAVH